MNKNQGHFQALNKKFFEKHQSKLLWLLNAPLIKYWFRWVLRIHKDLKWDEKICEIQPNNYKIYLGMYLIKGKLVHKVKTDFRTHNKFSKRLYYTFKPIWWTMHFIDWLFLDDYLPRHSFGFSVLTTYPAAGANSPVDGRAYLSVSNYTFANLRGGNGNGSSATEVNSDITLNASTTSNLYDAMVRGFFLFDTSSLGSGATISSSVLSLYATNKDDTFGNSYIGIVQAVLALTSSISNSDYENNINYTTRFATDLAFSSIVLSAYNDWSLNASGISNINKTGISQFGGKTNWDIDNTAPTWGSGKHSYTIFDWADQAGTSSDPKLVVTYIINYAQTISNTLSLSNSLVKGITRIASNTISLSDTVQSIKLILISISNTLNFSNSVQKGIGKAIENTANLTNSIFKDIYKSISNIVNSSNIISVAKIVYKTITNTVNFSNSIIKSISRSIENTAIFSDAISAIRTFTKIIVNTITLSNTISKGIAKTIINTIISTTKNLFNGLTTWYSDKYQKQNTDYSDKY